MIGSNTQRLGAPRQPRCRAGNGCLLAATEKMAFLTKSTIEENLEYLVIGLISQLQASICERSDFILVLRVAESYSFEVLPFLSIRKMRSWSSQHLERL
jgi:hypothetical protein